MSMDLINKILAVIGAALIAYLIFQLGKKLAERFISENTSKRVKDLVGLDEKQKVKPTDFGSQEYKIRLAFSKMRIDVYQKEHIALNIMRFSSAFGFIAVMNIVFGLPLLTSLVGSLGGILMTSTFADNSWMKMCNEIDKEIPIFLSGFTSTIQVNPNILQAVEEEASILAENSPLKKWLLDRLVRRGQDIGIAAMKELIPEAFRVSNSLGVMVFLINRLWRTGGMEWKRSFVLAAENIEGVMEAKLMGLAAGSAAKSSVKLIIGVTMFIMMIMARNPLFATAMEELFVQMVYAVATLMMIFGYGMMGNMIESKL